MSHRTDEDWLDVFRHPGGAEIARLAIGYTAMRGRVFLEGSTQDDELYLNGYRFERTKRPAKRDPPDVPRPWPTWKVRRTTIAELCGVVEREEHDPFDDAGIADGHLFVAYDRDPDRLGRNVATEERTYADPEYQSSFFDHPLSHLSARGMDDGRCLVFGYSPEGPSAGDRRI